MPTALNGQRVSASCTAASNVLPAFPRGAYTSGLLLPNGCLADWQQHLGRLAKSLLLLANGGVLNVPEALQQQLATALEAAQAWPAHAGSKGPQPPQQTTPDWWRQVEHLVHDSISAASDGLISSSQHDSISPSQHNNVEGCQPLKPAHDHDISRTQHLTSGTNGQQLPQSFEAQMKDPPALTACSSQTTSSGQAANSLTAQPADANGAQDHHGARSAASLHPTSGCSAAAGAAMQHRASKEATLTAPHTSTACSSEMAELPQTSVVHNLHDSNPQDSGAKLKHSEVAITVLVFPSLTQGGNSSSNGSNSNSHQLPNHFGTAEALAGGVRVFIDAQTSAGPHVQAGNGDLVLNVMAHATCYDRSKVAASVEVAVVGPPRSLPAAKDSRWPLDRAPLQSRMPPGAAEGILAAHDGRLLEGFITNFFVISGSHERLVVETAAEEEGVLGGIMRSQVLQACQRCSIPVKLSSPCRSNRMAWKGAFLTNSLRGIQQVHSICNDGATSPISGTWRVDLQEDAHITKLISQLKADIAHASSYDCVRLS